MNTTAKPPLSRELLDHFATFDSSWSRRRLMIYLAWKRAVWRWVTRGAHFTKRVLDVAGSALALLALAPVFAGVAVLIKLEDGGPIFFPQIRVGRFGRSFRMLKFRSMHAEAESRLREVLARNQHGEGVTFKLKEDPRITRVGRFLRRYSIDELPQFYNVLVGDMSLVGPRPPVPREVAKYSLADRRRLAVKPGITCVWQISGRAEIDFRGQVQLDVSYIESRNLRQDITIILKTVPAVLSGRGAY